MKSAQNVGLSGASSICGPLLNYNASYKVCVAATLLNFEFRTTARGVFTGVRFCAPRKRVAVVISAGQPARPGSRLPRVFASKKETQASLVVFARAKDSAKARQLQQPRVQLPTLLSSRFECNVVFQEMAAWIE